MIILGFVARSFYKRIIDNYERNEERNLKEIKMLKEAYILKDAELTEARNVFINYLQQEKQQLIQNIDSVKNLK